MVILLIPWFPSDAALADNQLAEPSSTFLHIERNAVFLSTERMTGNGHLDRLYRHDALPVPQSILRPPELASNCRALQPTWLTTATALGLRLRLQLLEGNGRASSDPWALLPNMDVSDRLLVLR